MGGPDAVVQEVQHLPVRAVHGVEGALDEVPVLRLEVGHVHLRVLQPRDEHEPRVHHHVGAAVQSRHLHRPSLGSPRREAGNHGEYTHVRNPNLLFPFSRVEVGPLLARGERRVREEVARHASGRTPGGAEQEVRWPANLKSTNEVEVILGGVCATLGQVHLS